MSKPLRIAYFVNSCHEHGTYFRFQNFAKWIKALGHEVIVYAADPDPRTASRIETREGIEYRIIRNSKGSRLWGGYCNPIQCVTRLFQSYEPCDVAHLWQSFPSAGLSWLFRAAGAKVRLYDWDDLWVNGLIKAGTLPWTGQIPRAITSRFEHMLPPVADHMTTVSHMLRDLAINRGARGISVIHHGYTPFDIPDRTQARRELGLRPDAFYIGFMGRTGNDLQWVFDGLRLFGQKYPQLRLAICGPDPTLLEPFLTDARDRVDALGQLSGRSVKLFASALDLGLLPLMDNPFNRSRLPIKLLDHVGAGVPLLCSEVGETALIARTMPWVIASESTRQGWLDALDATIDRFLKGNVPKVDMMALNQKWAWSNKAAEMVSIYNHCLANRLTTMPGPSQRPIRL